MRKRNPISVAHKMVDVNREMPHVRIVLERMNFVQEQPSPVRISHEAVHRMLVLLAFSVK